MLYWLVSRFVVVGAGAHVYDGVVAVMLWCGGVVVCGGDVVCYDVVVMVLWCDGVGW